MLVSVFPCFRVSQKRKIKRSPIDLKLHGTYFWKESNTGDLECTSGKKRGSHEVGGAPTPLRCALHPCGPLVAPLTYIFVLYIPIYPKTFEEQNRSGVPPPQAFVATKNQSGSLTGGHLHHPGALHDEEGVVHPRG